MTNPLRNRLLQSPTNPLSNRLRTTNYGIGAQQASPEESADIAAGANDRAARRFGWDETGMPEVGRGRSTPNDPIGWSDSQGRAIPMQSRDLNPEPSLAQQLTPDVVTAGQGETWENRRSRMPDPDLSGADPYAPRSFLRNAMGLTPEAGFDKGEPLPPGLGAAVGYGITSGAIGALGAGLEGIGSFGERFELGRYTPGGLIGTDQWSNEVLQSSGQWLQNQAETLNNRVPDEYRGTWFADEFLPGLGSMFTFIGVGGTAGSLSRMATMRSLGPAGPLVQQLAPEMIRSPQRIAQFSSAMSLAGGAGFNEQEQYVREFVENNPQLGITIDDPRFDVPLLIATAGGFVQVANIGVYLDRIAPDALKKHAVAAVSRRLLTAGASEAVVEGVGGGFMQYFARTLYDPEMGLLDRNDEDHLRVVEEVVGRGTTGGAVGFTAALLMLPLQTRAWRPGNTNAPVTTDDVVNHVLQGGDVSDILARIEQNLDPAALEALLNEGDASEWGPLTIDELVALENVLPAHVVAGDVSVSVDGEATDAANRYGIDLRTDGPALDAFNLRGLDLMDLNSGGDGLQIDSGGRITGGGFEASAQQDPPVEAPEGALPQEAAPPAQALPEAEVPAVQPEPQRPPAITDSVTSEGLPVVQQEGGGSIPFADARLKRESFRVGLQGLASELRRGGGSMGRKDTWDGERPRDGNEWIGIPSENPQWFQTMSQETGLTVDKTKNAITKALAGKRLGVAQARAIEFMLSEISGRRMGADSERGYGPDSWRSVLDQRRDQLRVMRGEATSAEADEMAQKMADAEISALGMEFAENEYAEGLESGDRQLFDAFMLAAEVDEALALREFNAGLDGETLAQRLWEISQGLHDEQIGLSGQQGPGLEAVPAEQGQGPRPGEARPTTDQAGGEGLPGIPSQEVRPDGQATFVPEDPTAQAQADADRSAQERADGSPDVGSGPGELFAGNQPGVRPGQASMFGDMDPAPATQPDRRRDAEGRKRVDQMSPEEMRQALMVDDLTGLGNRRAFEEALESWDGPVVSIDADSLKWINDNMSPEVGDQLLAEIGRAIRANTAEGEGFHISGDEFYILSRRDATEIMAAIEADLAGVELQRTTPDGTVVTKSGLQVTYGQGRTKQQADDALKAEKRDRESRGERAGRGQEPPGVSRQSARVPAEPEAGRQADGDPAPVNQGRRPVPYSPDPSGNEAGWVVKNRETGEVITEIQQRSAAEKINQDKYELVPIAEHLASLSTRPTSEAPATAGVSASGDAETAAQPEPARPAPSANTVFTDEAAEKARQLLRSKLGQLNTGIDPDVFRAGITLAGYHVERGARSFAAYARAMVGDMGDMVKPYLKAWYMGLKYDPSASTLTGLDSADIVDQANIDYILEATDEPNVRQRSSVEPDSGELSGSEQVGQESVPDGRRADSRGGEPGVQPAEADARPPGSERVSGRAASTPGERGDFSVQAGSTRSGRNDTGADVRGRSPDAGLDGAPVEPQSTAQVAKSAGGGVSRSDVAKAQAEANKRGARGNSLAEIRAELPALFPGQQEDVHIAEQRFSKDDGYGMLFTNGTGTGKTFTGLGVVRRFANRGQTNTLIVAPNDKIIEDWINSGKALGLDISRLKDTNDAGQGITITTYANMRANDALATRPWDLVVTDEAHYLAQSASGEETANLTNFKAITLHPESAGDRVRMKHREWFDRMAEIQERIKGNTSIMNKDDTMDQMVTALAAENATLEAERTELDKKINDALDQERAFVEENQGKGRTRALFLSATPFAYEKTVRWANGYLFDWNAGQPRNQSMAYNRGDNYDRFMMQHFGYRMRYNKLTEPGPEVNRGLMQRQFNSWLKKQGVLSGRMLDVEADYDRLFVSIESRIGRRIDEALDWLMNAGESQGFDQKATNDVRQMIQDQFDHLSRRYLLEAIKAKEVIPHIREHLDMGRKVVVFHDFKKGGGFNPFRFAMGSSPATDKVIAAFNAQFSDLVNSDLGRMPSPIVGLSQAFPDLMMFNGDVPKSQRRANVQRFNDDSSGPQVILVQSAAGKEGISLHDTTGKHPRVLFNLGLPTQPTTAIQQEGRIYRTGQVSNAMFRYLNTGTNWERWAFATTIAQRASAAENLGMGEQARALLDSFIAGFEQSGNYRAGMEGEGTGGKSTDAAANAALTEFDRAKSYYFATQKRNSRTKAQEGIDYFATPEPLGLKMTEWANVRGGESVLEPSAGHGAIARWIPENATRTAIEPSNELVSRLAMAFDGTIKQQTFEDLHISNKYDAIVMNPPFGRGGKTAIEHLDKATRHLRDGGRVVAIIPRGPAADGRFDKWLYEEDAKGRMVRPDLNLVASIDLPSATFERAGTSVRARVVVLDKGDTPGQVTRDLSNAENINELFDRLEDMTIPGRVAVQRAEAEAQAESRPRGRSAATEGAGVRSGVFELAETVHAKKGIDLFVAKVAERVDRDTFNELRSLAKQHGGYYSRFARDGAIPGFQFESDSDRQAFLAAAESAGVQESGPVYSPNERETGTIPAGQRESRFGRLSETGVAEAGSDPVQGDLFLAPRASAASDRPAVARRVRAVRVGAFRSGIERVAGPADAAHVVASLRKQAQEVFGFLVLDAQKRPLAFKRQHIGAVDEASVSMQAIGDLYEIPGAAFIYMIHNHPGTVASQGSADMMMTQRLAGTFEGTGIELIGSVVVAPGGEYSFFSPDRSPADGIDIDADYPGTQGISTARIPPAVRSQEVPVTERVLRGRAREPGKAIVTPKQAREYAKENLAGRDGVLLLNTRHFPIDFLDVSADEFARLRTGDASTGFGRLAAAISASNASASMIIRSKDVNAVESKNLNAALEALQVRSLDQLGWDGRDFESASERGQWPPGGSGGTFYSRSGAATQATSPSVLRGQFSQRAQRALFDSGLVTVTESPAQWPGNHPADAAGAWINGRIYLATNNIEAGSERGLILHEVGVHHGLQSMLGDQYDPLTRQLKRQIERGGRPGASRAQREAFEAHRRAKSDDTITGESALMEETIAYMAHAGANSSLFRQIVAAIRQFLRGLGLVQEFTNADIAHLARGSVARVVDGIQADQGASYAPAAYARYGDREQGSSDSGPDIRYSRNNQSNQEIQGSTAATPAVRQKQERGQPISREDVLNPLLQGLKIPVYQGRIKNASKYMPHHQAIRIRKMNDIEAVSFQIGYLLAERVPDIPRAWTGGANRLLRREMQALSKRGDSVEGFAQFMQLYLMENEAAAEMAPAFFERFNQLLNEMDGGESVRNAVRDIHAWHAQDTLSQARAKIGFNRHLSEMTTGWQDRVRQGVFDDLHGVLMAERELTGEAAPGGIYENARLIRGAGAIVEGAMHSWGGVPIVKEDGSFGYKGKALESILEPVADRLDDWIAYAVGRSSAELMAQGRENLFSRAEIKAMKGLESPAFAKAFDEYQEWNKGILDFAQALGLINPESRAQWRRTQYIPFYRIADRESQARSMGRRGEGVEGNWRGIKALTGGTGNLNDILGNMIQNARTIIEEAIKNDARRKIADAIDETEGGGLFMVKIPRESAPVSVSSQEIRREVMRAIGVQDGEALTEDQQSALEFIEDSLDGMDEFVKLWVHNRAPRGDNVIAVLRGGKPTFYEVNDPFLLRSLLHFNRPAKHPLIRAMSVIRRIGQTTVTLTPDFMAANLARDTLMASILSRHGFKPFVDSVRGMKSRLSKDQNYRDFMANGGGLSSLHADYLAYRKHLERFYARKGINARNVLDMPGKWLYALERLGESVEMGTRAGYYRQAVARGEHPRHAAYLAREIGSDYAMRGDSPVVNFLYDTVMFLKAGQNGLDRIYRGFASDPNRAAVAAKTGALALASAMLYLHNRGIPEYDELEDWDKDVHWHFLVPDGQGGYHHFRYPKIWQIGGIASIAERNMGALMDQLEGQGADGQKLISDIARITRDANFIGVTPQIASPWIEQYANRNSFTGAPIESMGMQNLEPWARATPYTNRVLRDLGEATMDMPRALQINPVRAEALLRGYFNTWATYGLDAAEAIYGSDRPARRVDELPVARRFYKQQPARRTRYETMFYDMLRETDQVHSTIRRMEEQGRFDAADRLEARRGDMLDFRTDLTGAQRELREIHREMRELQIAEGMNRREKREQIDRLQEDKNRLLRDLIEDITEDQRARRRGDE